LKKKLLILAAAAAALVLTLAIVSIASALHGGWDFNNETGNACASCHRVHTAAGPQLLKEQSAYLLCWSCHGDTNSGHGKDLNPWAGKNLDPGKVGEPNPDYLKPNNGGTMSPLWGATSQHTVQGLYLWEPAKVDPLGNNIDDPAFFNHTKTKFGDESMGLSGSNPITGVAMTADSIAWGGASSGKGLVGKLECVSCHDPHGSTNARHLRDSHDGSGDPLSSWSSARSQFGETDVDGDGTIDKSLPFQDHLVLETSSGYKGSDAGSVNTPGVLNYTAGMRDFCAACHKSYLTKSQSGHTPSSDNTGIYVNGPSTQITADMIFRATSTDPVKDTTLWDGVVYRHATSIDFEATLAARYPGEWTAAPDQGADDFINKPGGVSLRFAASSVDDQTRTEFVCTTCHFAHGTTANLTGRGSAPYSYASTWAGPAGDSALLVLNGRQVCFACHMEAKMKVGTIDGGTIEH
jgi:predicted CXXCH cytochrome family protein